MDELARNKEYHLAYLLGTDYEKRMLDVYTGLGTIVRPPFLEDIFTETTQTQALILLESVRDNPAAVNLSDTEWQELHKGVWEDDEYSKYQVLMMASQDEMNHIVNDMYGFIHKYRLCTLVNRTRNQNSFMAKFIHAPYTQVW